jgi:uncharacterized protein (DUF3084 family)
MKKLTQVNPGELKEKQKELDNKQKKLDEALEHERRMEQGLEELGTKKIKHLQDEIDKLKAANKELLEKIPDIEHKEGEFDDEEIKRKKIEFEERERQFQEREREFQERDNKQSEEQNQKQNQQIINNNALDHLKMCETDRSKLHEYLGNLNEYLNGLKNVDGVKSEDIENLLAQPKHATEDSNSKNHKAAILKEAMIMDTDPDRPLPPATK